MAEMQNTTPALHPMQSLEAIKTTKIKLPQQNHVFSKTLQPYIKARYRGQLFVYQILHSFTTTTPLQSRDG